MRVGPLAAGLVAAVLPALAGVKPGEPAPEIALESIVPERPAADATLHGLAGKAVVLEFWATWCGPCVEAIPHLNDLATRFQDRPVVFLSVTDEERPAVEAFLKKRPMRGWIGFAKGDTLEKSYGVEGIPDTFLIDPGGKIAANLFPDQLQAEMIEDLVAGRPVKAPRRPTFDSLVARGAEPGAPAALADVLIRPSASMHGGGMFGGKDRLAMKGGEIRWFFSQVYQMPASRMAGDALEDHTRYDLSISIPGANPIAFSRIESELLCAAFHVKVARETRDADVLILAAPNGKPADLRESDGVGGPGWNTGNGKLQMTNGGLADLARAMESVVQKPVLDETHVGGRYNLTIEFANPEGLLDAVHKLGLRTEAARRPIEFLVVTKAQ